MMSFPERSSFVFALALAFTVTAVAAPVIDPIPNINVPAGKSILLPITATSPNGRRLTYTATSSTNRITVEIHTNNPFWRMSVAQVAPTNAPGTYLTPFRGTFATVTNLGDMTFMLLHDLAPKTVDVFQGLTMAGYFSTNTIFHRVIPGFVIQAGDPATNGAGGPVFRYEDELQPRALFSGNGQLAMAHPGVPASKDNNGSQFFVTFGSQRFLDLGYTLFGQQLRGFDVATNIVNTPRNANDRPYADVIITRVGIVTNLTDTVITLTGTNQPGIVSTNQIIADDGAGGRATNAFTATIVSDAANNSQPILYPDTLTNLVAAVNGRLTNYISALDLDGNTNYFFTYFYDYASYVNASNTVYVITNGQMKISLIPATGYAGPIRMSFFVSSAANWSVYYENNLDPNIYPWPPYDARAITFAIGDTKLSAFASNFTARAGIPFTNQLLATFTNGVPNSAATNFTAFINWGDNSTNSGTIQTNVSGRKEVRGAHTYFTPGVFPVYVTLQSRLGAESNVIAVATVPPAVGLTRSNTNNVFRWPAWADSYQVQSLTNLTSTNWLTLTNAPTPGGYDYVLTNASTQTSLFFRLRK